MLKKTFVIRELFKKKISFDIFLYSGQFKKIKWLWDVAIEKG